MSIPSHIPSHKGPSKTLNPPYEHWPRKRERGVHVSTYPMFVDITESAWALGQLFPSRYKNYYTRTHISPYLQTLHFSLRRMSCVSDEWQSQSCSRQDVWPWRLWRKGEKKQQGAGTHFNNPTSKTHSRKTCTSRQTHSLCQKLADMCCHSSDSLFLLVGREAETELNIIPYITCNIFHMFTSTF